MLSNWFTLGMHARAGLGADLNKMQELSAAAMGAIPYAIGAALVGVPVLVPSEDATVVELPARTDIPPFMSEEFMRESFKAGNTTVAGGATTALEYMSTIVKGLAIIDSAHQDFVLGPEETIDSDCGSSCDAIGPEFVALIRYTSQDGSSGFTNATFLLWRDGDWDWFNEYARRRGAAPTNTENSFGEYMRNHFIGEWLFQTSPTGWRLLSLETVKDEYSQWVGD